MADENEVSEDDLKNMSAEEIAELQKQNCIFCKIANKDIPAKILHEDDDIICILDINPASEGHIIVFPKKHYMIMPHLPEDILGKLFNTVKLMSNTLLRTLQSAGTTIFVANGMAAGQKAPHVLIHVFPRKQDDGLLELPRHDITDEQAVKISSTLKPYIHRAFGSKMNNKIPEISVDLSENKQEKVIEQKPLEKKSENTDDKNSSEKIHDMEKKSEKPMTRTQQMEHKPAKSIDLDGVAKLFGG
jgi:histidine triad (HIT) family protein